MSVIIDSALQKVRMDSLKPKEFFLKGNDLFQYVKWSEDAPIAWNCTELYETEISAETLVLPVTIKVIPTLNEEQMNFFGWTWIEGEDDNEGNNWITINTVTKPDYVQFLDEEVCTLMLRQAEKFSHLIPQREIKAKFIVDALNHFAKENPQRFNEAFSQ